MDVPAAGPSGSLGSLKHLIAVPRSLAHPSLLRIYGRSRRASKSIARHPVCVVFWARRGFREKIMARSALAVLLVAAAVVLMASMETAQGAISCNQVTSALVPCASYILGGGAKPTAQCCNGVRALNAAAKSTPDRRTACGCLKSAAASYGANYGKSSKIPGLCGVKLGVPISASVDCSKVS